MNQENEAKNPLVSVIIVNWNGGKVLKQCLTALSDQVFQDFEIVVVDNGSTDGSVEGLEINYPGVQVKRLNQNRGFAAANNLGVLSAKGRWIALLNNDAFPSPGWLEALVLATEKNPDFTFFASCQIMSPKNGVVDGMGDVYHVSGMAWRRGHGRPLHNTRTGPEEVFGPCAAAALYRRDVFFEVGGFDEDYFCYHEDVDLAFRLRLRGNRCLYLPEAVVEHVGSSSQGARSDFVIYHSHRNLCWSFLKNMPSYLFWLYLPPHLLLNAAALIWFSLNGHGRAVWKAKWHAWKGLRSVLNKRRCVQRKRTIPLSEIKRLLDHHWFNPYRPIRKR